MDDSQWNSWFTPSTTPTNPSFSPTALQTPRTVNTHFQEAFFQPQNVSFSPADFSQQHFLQNDNAAMSFDAFQHQQLQQPYVRPQQQQQQQLHQSQQESNVDTQVHSQQVYSDSYQVQTPPPTRDQSSKRRSQRMSSVVFGTPSSMSTRRAAQGEQSSLDGAFHLDLSQTPRQADFVPDFAAYGAATAPVTMPGGVFWDATAATTLDQSSANLNWNTLDDPFTFNLQASTQAVSAVNAAAHFQGQAPSLQMQNIQPFIQPQSLPQRQQQQQHQQPHHRPVPSQDSTFQRPETAAVPQAVPNMMTSAAGVNPSLLYRSPNRFIAADNQSKSFAMPEQLPLQSARSTIQPAGPRPLPSQPRSRPNELHVKLDQPTSAGLRRSNTTGGSRPRSLYGSTDSLERSNTTAHLPRRPSPLKRVSRNSLTSIAEAAKARPRTSVVLTIDSQGRARTETRLLDPSPTKSLMSRYPDFWKDSDDESDSDASSQVPSQTSSFSASRAPDRHERQSKMARLDPPLEGLEGLHLPRSNSAVSMRTTPSKPSYTVAAQLRRQNSVKKAGYKNAHSRRNTMGSMNGSLNGSFSELPSPAPSSSDELAHDDAGAALRHAMESRASQTDLHSHHPQLQRTSFPQRPSSAFRTSQQQQQRLTHSFDSRPMSRDNSPTKSLDLNGALSSVTRCICNLPLSNGQLMIQCHGCHLWQHAACLGLQPHCLPEGFVCGFCKPIPKPQLLRGGWETTAGIR